MLVVEHEPETIAITDHVADLGHDGGHDGGRVAFAGTPANLVAARSTRTGEYLAADLGA